MKTVKTEKHSFQLFRFPSKQKGCVTAVVCPDCYDPYGVGEIILQDEYKMVLVYPERITCPICKHVDLPVPLQFFSTKDYNTFRSHPNSCKGPFCCIPGVELKLVSINLEEIEFS